MQKLQSLQSLARGKRKSGIEVNVLLEQWWWRMSMLSPRLSVTCKSLPHVYAIVHNRMQMNRKAA